MLTVIDKWSTFRKEVIEVTAKIACLDESELNDKAKLIRVSEVLLGEWKFVLERVEFHYWTEPLRKKYIDKDALYHQIAKFLLEAQLQEHEAINMGNDFVKWLLSTPSRRIRNEAMFLIKEQVEIEDAIFNSVISNGAFSQDDARKVVGNLARHFCGSLLARLASEGMFDALGKKGFQRVLQQESSDCGTDLFIQVIEIAESITGEPLYGDSEEDQGLLNDLFRNVVRSEGKVVYLLKKKYEGEVVRTSLFSLIRFNFKGSERDEYKSILRHLLRLGVDPTIVTVKLFSIATQRKGSAISKWVKELPESEAWQLNYLLPWLFEKRSELVMNYLQKSPSWHGPFVIGHIG